MHPSPSTVHVLTHAPSWLLPVLLSTPEMPAGPRYESLYLHRSRAEDTAFHALRWLLGEMNASFLVVQAQDIFDDATIAVPATDALAVAEADWASALFMLTGAFTEDQARALLASPRELLLQSITAPANVLTPPQESQSRFGLVTKGGWIWCLEQTPDNEAVLAGGAPAQGMLRAITDAGAFRWINRRDFALPAGLESAYE